MKKNNTIKIVIKIAIALLMCAFLALIAFRKSIFSADSFFYNLYEEDVASDILVKLVKSVVVLFIGALIIMVASLISSLGEKEKNNMVKTITLLVGNILKYVSAIGILLAILSAWGVDISVLVTGVGVLTLIIGLGCQSLVSDIVAGLFMIFEGDIKVGDVVVVNGWRGTVIQIGLRRTKIEDIVGNINIVNNSSISNIINNTLKLSVALCEVGIEYNESIERVEAILAENMHIFKEHIPAIVEGPFYKGVSELGASSVVIRILAKCAEEDKYQVERDMNREMKLLFDKYNINIPFDQVVVNYRDESEKEATAPTASDAARANAFLRDQREISKGIEGADR